MVLCNWASFCAKSFIRRMNDNMHLVDDVVGLEIGGQREIVIKQSKRLWTKVANNGI